MQRGDLLLDSFRDAILTSKVDSNFKVDVLKLSGWENPISRSSLWFYIQCIGMKNKYAWGPLEKARKAGLAPAEVEEEDEKRLILIYQSLGLLLHVI